MVGGVIAQKDPALAGVDEISLELTCVLCGSTFIILLYESSLDSFTALRHPRPGRVQLTHLGRDVLIQRCR